MKQAKKAIFLWPLSKKKCSAFKNLRFMAMFFCKAENVQTLKFLLVKNIGKDFSNLKNLITKDQSSLNNGSVNLLFHFTDS